jgi:hypothetical protein
MKIKSFYIRKSLNIKHLNCILDKGISFEPIPLSANRLYISLC